jgi:membrane protein implicated in regulation of membrane protease activity
MFLQDPLFWFTLCLILVVVEILGSNKLYSMFFSFGALITALLAFVVHDAYLLAPVFFVVSLLMSLIIKSYFKEMFVERRNEQLNN